MARLGSTSSSSGNPAEGFGRSFTSLFQPKSLIAIALALLAIASMVFAWRRANPPLKQEAPVANQMMAQQMQDANQKFQTDLKAMNLNPEQKKKVDALLKSGRNTRPRLRRQQLQELSKTLNPEQQKQLQTLMSERRAKLGQLRAARQERMRRMLGDADYVKHQQNMQQVRQTRQARQQNQTKPTPIANK